MQQFIKAVLNILKAICNCVEEAYEITYKETSKNFNKELKRRQEENKKEFFETVMRFVKNKYREETGMKMPDSIANDFAKAFFRVAKSRGEINFLNKLDIDRKE